jgi:hypothetical protein
MRCIALVCVGVNLLAAPASARSVWDPHDVKGPLDIRWMSAVFTANHRIRLTISFYPRFRATAIPKVRDRHGYAYWSGRGGLELSLIDYFSVFFARRRDGRVILLHPEQGDEIERARIVSADVLRVWVPKLDPGLLDIDATYFIQAHSSWDLHRDTHRDRTRGIALGFGGPG